MKKKETARIKKTANFVAIFPNQIEVGWTTLDGNEKVNYVRLFAKEALNAGKRTYSDIADYIFFRIKQFSPTLTNDRNYFLSANLWIWKTGEALGGIIGEEIKNFEESVQGQQFKKQQELDALDLQSAKEEKERQKAIKDKELQQELAAPSTAKVALIAGGVIFLIILGIFLYKKYA